MVERHPTRLRHDLRSPISPGPPGRGADRRADRSGRRSVRDGRGRADLRRAAQPAALGPRAHADGRTRARRGLAAHARPGESGDDRRVPPGVPRSGAAARRAHGAGPDAGRRRHARVRRRHGPRRTVTLSGRVDRRAAPRTVPALRHVGRPPDPDGRRRGGRRGGDLQGTGHGRGVRARGALPGRLRPQDAPPRARGRGLRLPRFRVDPRDEVPDTGARHTAALGGRPRRECRARPRGRPRGPLGRGAVPASEAGHREHAAVEARPRAPARRWASSFWSAISSRTNR